jgi:hypothetical protein
METRNTILSESKNTIYMESRNAIPMVNENTAFIDNPQLIKINKYLLTGRMKWSVKKCIVR